MALSTLETEEGTHRSAKPSTHCRCETCKRQKGMPNKLGAIPVRDHFATPRGGWRPRGMKGEVDGSKAKPYFLGVELETDDFAFDPESRRDPYGDRRTIGSLVGESTAADMKRPKRLWIAKSDSSVSGPEFASQPATFRYWKSKERELREMFRMLLHAGYRSYDNDRCGMHVNISKHAFIDRPHLARFATLLHASPEWAQRMSQRTEESLAWAKLSMNDSEEMKRWVMATLPQWNDVPLPSRRNIFGEVVPRSRRSRVPYYDYDRYLALNGANEDRLEFRLPRGTLRIDRFYKNLEWTVAMIEFTRPEESSTSPMKFMRWVLEKQSDEYPNLGRFILERRMLVGSWSQIMEIEVPDFEVEDFVVPIPEVAPSLPLPRWDADRGDWIFVTDAPPNSLNITFDSIPPMPAPRPVEHVYGDDGSCISCREYESEITARMDRLYPGLSRIAPEPILAPGAHSPVLPSPTRISELVPPLNDWPVRDSERSA